MADFSEDSKEINKLQGELTNIKDELIRIRHRLDNEFPLPRPSRNFTLGDESFVFLFTMGKVASTTLAFGLQEANYPFRKLQWLDPANEEFLLRLRRYLPMRHLPTPHVSYSSHLMLTARMRWALQDLDLARSLRVLTAVRDPVDQILSHIFHNAVNFEAPITEELGDFTPGTVTAYVRQRCLDFLELEDTSLPALIDLFDRRPAHHVFVFFLMRTPFHWIDENIRRFLHVDLYDTAFDMVGCNRNVFIVRSDRLDAAVEPLRQFLGAPDYQPVSANIGEEKEFGGLYRKVKSSLTLPAPFLDHAYSSRYAQHFFSEADRMAFRARWED